MKQEYSFLSHNKSNHIHCVRWIPEKEPIAILYVIHGMQEYVERYQDFAEFMRRRGFLVAGHDHIGHGKTAWNISDLGNMHATNPKKSMVEDITTHFQLLRKEYPTTPFFILGHSMGSYLLRCFLAEKAPRLKSLTGVILMGTGTEKNSVLTAGRVVLHTLAVKNSWSHKSDFVKGLMFNSAYHKFNIDGTAPENSWLSTNTEANRAFYADPYCNYTFSLGGYLALVDAAMESNLLKGIERIPKDLPIHFVSGSEDPVGGLGKGVNKAYQKFKKVGPTHVSIRMYKGLRHELLHEPCRNEIYQDLYEWMSTKI
ncbi:MAG: lysophospholipase [Lachnospiraceae bacterium]|nr:lysophospholipase [Lachnospiraceae bacterium]